jgi:hypothetical protein
MAIRRAVRAFLSSLFADDADAKQGQETSLDGELIFLWSDFPDPLLPNNRVHVCELPGGGSIMVQEVSAPEPGVGHIGWQLLDVNGAPVEIRNGFFEVDKAKTHAEDHFRKCYVTPG